MNTSGGGTGHLLDFYLEGTGGASAIHMYINGNQVFYLDGSGNLQQTGNIFPTSTNQFSLGTPTNYWQDIYGSRLYLNSTAYF